MTLIKAFHIQLYKRAIPPTTLFTPFKLHFSTQTPPPWLESPPRNWEEAEALHYHYGQMLAYYTFQAQDSASPDISRVAEYIRECFALTREPTRKPWLKKNDLLRAMALSSVVAVYGGRKLTPDDRTYIDPARSYLLLEDATRRKVKDLSKPDAFFYVQAALRVLAFKLLLAHWVSAEGIFLDNSGAEYLAPVPLLTTRRERAHLGLYLRLNGEYLYVRFYLRLRLFLIPQTVESAFKVLLPLISSDLKKFHQVTVYYVIIFAPFPKELQEQLVSALCDATATTPGNPIRFRFWGNPAPFWFDTHSPFSENGDLAFIRDPLFYRFPTSKRYRGVKTFLNESPSLDEIRANLDLLKRFRFARPNHRINE